MDISPEKLQTILVDTGLISSEDFVRAKNESEKNNKSVTDILIDKNVISDENLGQAIAADQNVRFVSLSQQGIDPTVSTLIPEHVARSQGIIIFGKRSEDLKVAMINPFDLELISLIEKKTGKELIIHLATKRDIEVALDSYQQSLSDFFDELLGEIGDGKKRDYPTVEVVDALLEYAYKNKASDIHIEPRKHKIVVRYRIDGVMTPVVEMPLELLDSVVTRIKVMAELRTDEHFAAQDGKIVIEYDGKDIDLRVSIIPITNGEKVVMRLLSDKTKDFTLNNLGMQPEDLKTVKTALAKPWGMILATGPTGSGKTTSLYAALKILNSPDVNISTIEDPVEYDIDAINQIQVNTQTNLTFAKGLRSVVRQDPDIIMVGEIRDEETASIAVNSAMTGHLVLSTLHTNDAATTLPRLLEMNVEPFLISSTVNVAIAQRLVRKNCLKCRVSVKLSKKESEVMRKSFDKRVQKIISQHMGTGNITLYQSHGNVCTNCNNTGYSGRTGIFEVMEVTEDMKKLIMKRANASEIREFAIKNNNMTTMLEDGIKKVAAGITTMEEILRVTQR